MSLDIVDRRGGIVLAITVLRVLAWLAVLLALAAMCLAVLLASEVAMLWPGLVVLFLVPIAFVFPDGNAGLLALLAYAGWWLFAVDSPAPGPALLGATGALALHLLLAHAAAGPENAATQPAVVLATLQHALVVLAGTVLVTALVLAVDGSFRTPAVVVGLVLAAVGALVALADRAPD